MWVSKFKKILLGPFLNKYIGSYIDDPGSSITNSTKATTKRTPNSNIIDIMIYNPKTSEKFHTLMILQNNENIHNHNNNREYQNTTKSTNPTSMDKKSDENNVSFGEI